MNMLHSAEIKKLIISTDVCMKISFQLFLSSVANLFGDS